MCGFRSKANSWIINKSVRLSVFRSISDITMPFATSFRLPVHDHANMSVNRQPGEAKPGQLEEDFRGVR